jgi:Zn finger protein HypA/HybF involved in hydrogenase expression
MKKVIIIYIENIHPICNCKLIKIEYPKNVHETELYCPVCRDKNFELFEVVRTIIEHREPIRIFV